jgi:hypothetical protein
MFTGDSCIPSTHKESVAPSRLCCLRLLRASACWCRCAFCLRRRIAALSFLAVPGTLILMPSFFRTHKPAQAPHRL